MALTMCVSQFVLLLAFVCLASSVAVADDSSDVDRTIAKIELLGGEVTRDDTLPGRPVTGVDFQESDHVKDGYLDLLRHFTSLKSLSLRNTQITDAGLTKLRHLKHLTSLDLYHTQITDVGLKELVELTNLTSLCLWNTEITDIGVKELNGLKGLTELDLSKTMITEDCFQDINQHTQLTTLHLSGMRFRKMGVGFEGTAWPQEPENSQFRGQQNREWRLEGHQPTRKSDDTFAERYIDYRRRREGTQESDDARFWRHSLNGRWFEGTQQTQESDNT